MAAPVYHDPPVDDILGFHARFDPPEGYKAEIIGGNFVMSPSPSRRHGLVYGRLHAQLSQLLPAPLVVTNTVTVDLPATGERYIPDLLVVSDEVLDSDEWLLEAKDAELVAEIVSPSNAAHDRVTMLRGYAASGVPCYLLVDPLEKAVTLFTEPAGELYQRVLRVPFGDTIPLPEPYPGHLDTSVFG